MTGRRVVRDATGEEALQLGLVPGTRAVWIDETVQGAVAYGWTVASSWERTTRRCSFRGCQARPVTALWRPRKGARDGLARWLYCRGHSYGRVVEGFSVLCLVRIPEAGQ